jgi:ABC-type amino acid transport system permease subunit
MTAAQPPISQQHTEAVETRKRKGRMDQLIETLASGLGNSVGWMAENGILFAIFAVVWVAFAAGLIFSQGSVDQAWQTIRELPLIVQIVVWILFLPVMIGLWIWETTWPLVVRLVLVVGVAGWNLFMFLPKALQAKP